VIFTSEAFWEIILALWLNGEAQLANLGSLSAGCHVWATSTPGNTFKTALKTHLHSVKSKLSRHAMPL